MIYIKHLKKQIKIENIRELKNFDVIDHFLKSYKITFDLLGASNNMSKKAEAEILKKMKESWDCRHRDFREELISMKDFNKEGDFFYYVWSNIQEYITRTIKFEKNLEDQGYEELFYRCLSVDIFLEEENYEFI